MMTLAERIRERERYAQEHAIERLRDADERLTREIFYIDLDSMEREERERGVREFIIKLAYALAFSGCVWIAVYYILEGIR